MSFENLIKIEPKHIYEYNTNIINNNKIDCVNIEETVFEPDYSEVFNIYFNVLTRENDTLQLSQNESIKDLTLTQFTVSYSGVINTTTTVKMAAFNVVMDSSSSLFINDFKCVFKYTERERDGNYVTTTNRTQQFYPSSSLDFYFVDSMSDFLNESTSLQGAMGIDKNYSSNFKRTVYCKFRYSEIVTGTFDRGNIVTNASIHIYARKTKRETKSYALNSSGQCVLTSEIPNFRAKYPYTYPSNELFQEGATSVNKYNNNAIEPLSKCVAHSILYQFKNGKQTATMTVNCLDYYDINGNKVIGEGMDRKTLKAGDIVIPYIKPDVPLARKKDGTPKKFCITSAEFEYSGRPLMNLIMEEVIE